MSKGYYKIPRDIHNSIKAKRNNKSYGLELAVLCLLGERVRYNGNYCDDLEIGQCRVGRDELALAIGTTPQRIRTVLKTLQELTIIQPATNQQGTLITILRSDIYTMVQPTTNQQSTSNQPLTENKNKNKNKEKKNTVEATTLLMFQDKHKDKYDLDFLKQEFDNCVEWWYSNKGIFPPNRGFASWVQSNGFKSRWGKSGKAQDPLIEYFQQVSKEQGWEQ